MNHSSFRDFTAQDSLAQGGLFFRFAAAQEPEDRPTLLLLHGLFGSSANWASHVRGLSRARHVYLFDLNGHDGSRSTGAAGYRGMVDSVLLTLSLLKAQGGPGLEGPLHILGHSMGGKVAMLLALLHPQSWRSLIVGDIAPTAYPASHHQAILDVLSSENPGAWSGRAEAEQAIARSLSRMDERSFIGWNLRPRPAGGFEWKFDAPGLLKVYDDIAGWPSWANMGGKVSEDFSPSRVPGLFLKGQLSDYISADHRLLIASLFPESEILTLPDAGHWIQVDQKELFLRVTDDFLCRMDG